MAANNYFGFTTGNAQYGTAGAYTGNQGYAMQHAAAAAAAPQQFGARAAQSYGTYDTHGAAAAAAAAAFHYAPRQQATYDKGGQGGYYGQGQVGSSYGSATGGAAPAAPAEGVSSSYAAQQPTAKSSFASAYRPAQAAAKVAPSPQQQGGGASAGSNPAAAATYLYSGYATGGTGYGGMQNSGGGYHGQNSGGGGQHQTGAKLPWGAGGGGAPFKRAGPFVPKMGKPKPPPKAPQLHYCEVCKISCAGPQTYKEHLEGQKHKKKEAALKSNGAAGAPPLPRGGTALRCELCDVTCTGSDAYAAHIRGAKHQKVVKLHTKLGKPIPSTEPVVIAPPSGTTTAKAGATAATTTTTAAAAAGVAAGGGGDTKVADGEAGSQGSEEGAGDSLDKGVEVQPVGQDYIEEMRNDEGKVISFQCKLCECRFNDPNAKEMHMKGRRHRLQYKKKVNPDLVVDIKPSLRQRKLQEERLRRQLRDDFWKRREEDRWRDEMRMMEEEERMYWEERRRFEEEMEWCRWYGRGGMPMPPWPPMPGPPMGMPMPRRPDSVDDRHVMAKHSQIYPKEEDLGLVQRMVTNTEKALKMVSDALADGLEPKAEATPAAPAAAAPAAPAEDGKKVEAKKEEAPQQQRLLKGVMRVGVLAKGLLLAGDLTVGLVVMCSEKPGRTLLARVAALLPKHLADGRSGFKNVYHADCEADRIESRKLLLAAMKHDSWTVSKFRAWKKEQSQPPMAPSGPDKTPSSLLAAVDPAVDPAAVGKYKRSRYNDRKFLQKPKTGGDAGNDDFGSAIFGSRVSLRTMAPADAVSIHANTAPLRLPVAFPTRPTAFGSYGRYQEPLSQWQIAADMYIDSDIRKRARRRLVGRACEARTPLPPVERVERRPAEPCPRRQEVDLELGIPRRRLVLQGPLYSSSYAHWYSRVFSPPSPSTGEP